MPKTLLAFACVALLFSTVVVPVFRVNSGASESILWIIAPLSISGVAAMAVVVGPWLQARPVRVELASQTTENPSSLVFPAGMNNGETAVVLADKRGLGIVDRAGVVSWSSWDEIRKVLLEKTDRWPNQRVGIIMKTGSVNFAFVPLRRDAVQPIRRWKLEVLVTRLEAMDQKTRM